MSASPLQSGHYSYVMRGILLPCVIAVLLGAHAQNVSAEPRSNPETAAVCRAMAPVNALRPAIESRHRLTKAIQAHPDADERLRRAARLLERAVPNRRTLRVKEGNKAFALLRSVCLASAA